MKSRIIAAVLVALMLCAILPCTAQAAGTTYTLDELGMTVRIPDTYTVVTRDTPADDPFFATYGVTQEEFLEDMEAIDSYLEAVDDRRQYTITISGSRATSSGEYSSTTGSTLLPKLAINTAEGYEGLGYDCLGAGTYTHPQTNFFWILLQDSTGSILQYSTIYAGKQFYLQLNTLGTSIDEESMKAVMEEILDSTVFADIPPSFAETAFASYEYDDEELGVTFSVPEGWREVQAAMGDGESKLVTFQTGTEAEALIQYIRADQWSQLSEKDRRGHTRSDLQQDAIDETFVEEALMQSQLSAAGKITSQTEPKAVWYGGTQYYQITYEITETRYALTSIMSTTALLHLRNGWIYGFCFTGDPGSAYYDDFEAMLESVTYPPTSSANIFADTSDDLWGPLIDGIVELIFLCLLGYGIYLFKKRFWQKESTDEQADAGAAADAAAEGTQSQDAQPRCPVCRTVLPDGARTCPRCGADPTDPTTRRCATCGAPLPANRRFCSQCGADSYETSEAYSVPDEAKDSPSASDSIPRPATKSCPFCGAALLPDSAFCDVCGAALPPSEAGE